MVPCTGVVGRMKRKENGDIPPVKNVKAKLIDGKSQNVQVSREFLKLSHFPFQLKKSILVSIGVLSFCNLSFNFFE